MTDYSTAAMQGLTAILTDGSEVVLSFNPAGQNGWLIDVIVAYDQHDDSYVWDTDGNALGHDADILVII